MIIIILRRGKYI